MINIEQIIEGCRNGDKAMQKELYERFSSRFYALCRRYATDDEYARDILIDGFISIFKNIDKYNGLGSFEGWMGTIFIRTAIAYYRNKMQQQRAIQSAIENESRISETAIERIDIRDALMDALRVLPDKERAVFNLVVVEEYTMREAGEAMGVSESTIKSQYYRALQTVRKVLHKRLGNNYLRK